MRAQREAETIQTEGEEEKRPNFPEGAIKEEIVIFLLIQHQLHHSNQLLHSFSQSSDWRKNQQNKVPGLHKVEQWRGAANQQTVCWDIWYTLCVSVFNEYTTSCGRDRCSSGLHSDLSSVLSLLPELPPDSIDSTSTSTKSWAGNSNSPLDYFFQ